jgi:hypothetical protein
MQLLMQMGLTIQVSNILFLSCIYSSFLQGFSDASLLVTLDQREMGYYLGAPHVDTPVKGVRTNLLFLTAGNAGTTFLAGPGVHNNGEADKEYPEGEIFYPGMGATSRKWSSYLKKRFVFDYWCIFICCTNFLLQIWFSPQCS